MTDRAELEALADAIADRLGVDPEAVLIEPPRGARQGRISLSVEQARALLDQGSDQ